MDSLLSLFTHALITHGQQRTASSLGDRSQYVGISDIAKAADCLRAAVAGKLPCSSTTLSSLCRELRLQRGHWFEQGVVNAFAATGQPFLHQLEIRIQHHGIPMQAHLDFVFIEECEGEPAHIRVIECKSCENIPETAYASHEMQVYGQMGLLRACWHQPCFTLPVAGDKSTQKPTTFPALVKQATGLSLPKNVEDVIITGSILCLSMNNAKVFGPYSPNGLMLNACLNLGESLWTHAAAIRAGESSLNDVPTAKGHHPLCDYCEVNKDCPRFKGVTAAEIEDDLQYLAQLKKEKGKISQVIQKEEEKLKHLYRASLPQGGWLSAETSRVRLVLRPSNK